MPPDLCHCCSGPGFGAERLQAFCVVAQSAACCREHETKFLVRTLVSNLRVGANWRSVIGAMARAVMLHQEGPRVPKARLDAAANAASEAYHVSSATSNILRCMPRLVSHLACLMHRPSLCSMVTCHLLTCSGNPRVNAAGVP